MQQQQQQQKRCAINVERIEPATRKQKRPTRNDDGEELVSMMNRGTLTLKKHAHETRQHETRGGGGSNLHFDKLFGIGGDGVEREVCQSA